jgi:hypothetical protein
MWRGVDGLSRRLRHTHTPLVVGFYQTPNAVHLPGYPKVRLQMESNMGPAVGVVALNT